MPAPVALRWAALAGVAGFLVLLGVCHVLRPGLDPLRVAISDYGVGRGAAVFMAALLVLAAVKLAVALMVLGASPSAAARVGAWVLLLDAAATVVVAFFPTDAGGAPATLTGRVHVVAASIAFVADVVAFLAVGFGAPATTGVAV